MNKLLSISLFSLAMLFMACQPMNKNQYLGQYRSFMDEVKESHDSYSDSDWEQKNESLNKYLGAYYEKFEEELTTEEKAEVWADAMKYYFYQYKTEALQLISESKDEEFKRMREHMEIVADSGTEILEDLLPELEKMGEEFKDFFEEWKGKNEGLFKDLGEKLKELGEKLEEAGKK